MTVLSVFLEARAFLSLTHSPDCFRIASAVYKFDHTIDFFGVSVDRDIDHIFMRTDNQFFDGRGLVTEDILKRMYKKNIEFVKMTVKSNAWYSENDFIDRINPYPMLTELMRRLSK